MKFFDDNFWWQFLWQFLMTFFDDNFRWQFWWQFLVKIFGDNFWWQFLMTIFYDNFLSLFLMTNFDDNFHFFENGWNFFSSDFWNFFQIFWKSCYLTLDTLIRHWLHCWQLRTTILTITLWPLNKEWRGQHSQFLRCFLSISSVRENLHVCWNWAPTKIASKPSNWLQWHKYHFK